MLRYPSLCKPLLVASIRYCSADLKPKRIQAESREELKETKIKFKPSERYLKFKERLQTEAPPTSLPHPAHEKEPLQPWPNNTNPHTGEIGGPRGLEPTRYGDWQSKGRVTDF